MRYSHDPVNRYAKLRVAHAPGMPGTFSPPPRVSDPDMHHGTCVMHVPWWMPGSLISSFLWIRWREKCSQHYWRMRNPQCYVSGKRPIEVTKWLHWFVIMWCPAPCPFHVIRSTILPPTVCVYVVFYCLSQYGRISLASFLTSLFSRVWIDACLCSLYCSQYTFLYTRYYRLLYCVVLYCIALHCIALDCFALHCIALYCIVLYCIVLYREKWFLTH